jgi:hypothetical protein
LSLSIEWLKSSEEAQYLKNEQVESAQFFVQQLSASFTFSFCETSFKVGEGSPFPSPANLLAII